MLRNSLALNSNSLRRFVLFCMKTPFAIACMSVAVCLCCPVDGRAQSKKYRPATSPRKLQLLQEKRAKLYADLSLDLEDLAKWCDDRGLTEAAAATRRVASRNTGGPVLSDVSLPKYAQLPIDKKLPPDEFQRQTQLRQLRRKYAAEVYRLSREALRGGYPSFSMELIKETSIHDPDHKNARRILGYQAFFDRDRQQDKTYAGEWVSPFAARQMSPPRRHVWDDRFGWIPQTQLKEYNDGKRPWKGRWITAEREAEYRRDFNNAWEIRTDHFLVKTNYSQKRGVEIAVALERYHDFFKRTIPSFFETPEELEKKFIKKTKRARDQKPFVVHFYATREEYNRRLIGDVPQIAMTNGMYHDDKIVHFYHDSESQNDATLFHEATHQILDFHTEKDRMLAARARASKTRQRIQPWVVGGDNNFWMIEGIACYMESLKEEGGRLTTGNRQFARFATAHQRIATGGYYMPMQKMSAMGRRAFQTDKNIAKNYTQASGFVHFLIHYNNGLYRNALVGFLTELYRPDLSSLNHIPSIAEQTGVPFEILDLQYRDYMLSWTEASEK